MSLRRKVLSILLGVILLYSGAEYAVHRWFIFPGFLALEEQQAEEDLKRVRYAIEKEVGHLDVVCRDWAAWDDMYRFVDFPSDDFIASNFVLSSFLDNRINLIHLYNNKGQRIWGETREITEGNTIPLALFEPSVLPEVFRLPASGGEPADLRVAGLLATEHGPLLVSARPVLTSDKEGPIRGTLIMGRLLDASLAAELVMQTRLDFVVRQQLPTFDNFARAGQDSDFPQFDKSDEKRLVTWQSYPDLQGEPAFLIKLESSRTLIQTVHSLMRHVLLSLVVAGLVMLVLLSALLQRIVLGPLSRLAEHARIIRRSNDLSSRIHTKREDEIGHLSCEFDGMMAEIEQKATTLAEVNAELQRLSDEDIVTHLANRRKFESCLSDEWKRMLREQLPLSLIFCDIDFFKPYNDTYGHVQGDQCLGKVAQAVRNCIHRPGDLVARFGGEEFVTILAGTDGPGAVIVAEAMRREVRSLKIPHRTSAVDNYVTLSAGVATIVPAEGLFPEELLKLADQALYQAKQLGRNRVCRHESNADHIHPTTI